MNARSEELTELLTGVARLSEIAGRHQLTFASQLLDMLQLEVTMAMFGYSDDPVAPTDVDKPPRKRSVARSGGRRARHV